MINKKKYRSMKLYARFPLIGPALFGPYSLWAVFRALDFGLCVSYISISQLLTSKNFQVFQRRQDGSVDFYRGWTDYKTGFGDKDGEFWLGNDNLHLLTLRHDQKLKVELQYPNETVHADYSTFWIEDEDEQYKLRASGFSGEPGLYLQNTQQRWFMWHLTLTFDRAT